MLLCTSAPLVLCCDWFDRGSKQVKREPVDLVMEDYDVSLCQQIVAHVVRKFNTWLPDHIVRRFESAEQEVFFFFFFF